MMTQILNHIKLIYFKCFAQSGLLILIQNRLRAFPANLAAGWL